MENKFKISNGVFKSISIYFEISKILGFSVNSKILIKYIYFYILILFRYIDTGKWGLRATSFLFVCLFVFWWTYIQLWFVYKMKTYDEEIRNFNVNFKKIFGFWDI